MSVEPSQWMDYKPTDDNFIPIERWGHDHFSTLAYLETRAVDHCGVVDNARMRCDPRIHSHFLHYKPYSREVADGSAYPTRLQGDAKERSHDDFSCVDDFVAAGLMTAEWRVRYPNRTAGHCELRVTFTERGFEIVAQLRQHRAGGGRYANFIPFKEVANGE